MTIATELSDLHQAIDQLPESAIPKLARYLRALLVETHHKQVSSEEKVENQENREPSDFSYAEYAEREELRAWLNISEPSYSFWDNEKDAAYDAL